MQLFRYIVSEFAGGTPGTPSTLGTPVMTRPVYPRAAPATAFGSGAASKPGGLYGAFGGVAAGVSTAVGLYTLNAVDRRLLT